TSYRSSSQALTLLQATRGILYWGKKQWSGSPTTPRAPESPSVGNVRGKEARCGSILTVGPGDTYIITSPGYPATYAPFTYCRWTFYSLSRSDNLRVSCPVFEMETTLPCSSGAFLALQDSTSLTFQWFCGNAGPQDVATTMNFLDVHFWSSWQSSKKKGFYCTVSTSPQPLGPGTCRCGRRGTSTRIVGGTDAGLHEFPWQALVLIPSGFCGGVLINERFVLTAAHCIDSTALPNGALPEVVLGEHQRSTQDETPHTMVLQAARVVPHESYGQPVSAKDNDIGLIELASSVDLEATPNIAPACPPGLDNYDSTSVIAIGWGFTSFPGKRADVLQKVDLVTVPLEQCRDKYLAGLVTENMICAAAEGKDACFDDSGGPLMTRAGNHWQVIGIVSFGPTACADKTVPGVYTRVTNYIPWILSKIGNARTCPPA
ncbi:trypsin-1-like, partial [Panulirus ornatus]|uniref:trypsin-1-like n=1 Tax=Panulirus ornatus TaxID=150431 RepID=UPI003A892A94